MHFRLHLCRLNGFLNSNRVNPAKYFIRKSQFVLCTIITIAWRPRLNKRNLMQYKLLLKPNCRLEIATSPTITDDIVYKEGGRQLFIHNFL